MAFNITENYLESVQKQFLYYKDLADKSVAQLSETEFFYQVNEHSNSIAIIYKHLIGNIKSRWTDFLDSDGEKDWRNRDMEFELEAVTHEMLLQEWEAAWRLVFEAIAAVNTDNIQQLVYIRNIGHSIIEAFQRQLCHYSSHIGQIVFIAKMIKGENWQTLSIAKGQSKAYNAEKFKTEKHRGHFSDHFLTSNDETVA